MAYTKEFIKLKNKEHIRKHREKNKNNKEYQQHVLNTTREYREKNKEVLRIKEIKRNEKSKKEITDRYLKISLSARFKIKFSQITPELIEIYRLQFQFRNLIKEKKATA